MNLVKVKYFAENGTEIKFSKATLEEAILEYRERRKQRRGANWGKYSIDNGETWHYL